MTYYADEAVTLHHGNSLELLPTLPDASVDAVVTDPPYEISMMNRAWDSSGIAYNVDVWRQCWRVLKPGGHLLAFGAPRTYHRVTVAIEDAGFEIRDSLHWIYGSGFPKGQDIAKSIDKRRDDRAKVLQVTQFLATARDAAGWTNQQIDALWGFNGMAGHWTTQGKAACVPTLEQWDRLREVLAFTDIDVAALVAELNGRKGEAGEAWAKREVIGQRTTGLGTGRGAVPVIQASENLDLTAPASDAARQWQGWNTALKPAHEPIVMARKSTGFNTTVANVLEHGTGALNIAATRISPSSPELVAPASSPRSVHGSRLDSEPAAGGPSPGSLPRTSPEQPACSTACTCPARESERPHRSPDTQQAPGSEPSRGRRNDPRSSALGGGSGYRPLQDSLDGCPSSRRSGDEHALSAKADGRASALRRRGVHESPAPDAAPGRSPAGLSKPCPNCTAGHVQRSEVEQGRWPTNILLGHSPDCVDGGDCQPGCPVVEMDRQSGITPSNARTNKGGSMGYHGGTPQSKGWAGDVSGGASRFFPVFRYEAKAPASERPRLADGTAHTTVKPLALMRWLVRLVTPPGGTVLDPFAGSGTTLEACRLEGFHSVGIELDAAHAELCRVRLNKPYMASLFGDLPA